ncbi:MAG: aminotransferase class V-fold PLP-dependent enzyme [Gammaproteobacteria bacterium]|nr:aminotransferase class V-fold PLP-dependent enzyme [Gammaproteobacteria bacterium]
MSIESLIAEEFPQDPALIYMNHAGVGPWPRRTARAVQAFAEENVRSGARNYAARMRKEQELKDQLRRFINAPAAEDIALVASTSAALSMVACGIDWKWGDNVVGPAEEFPSNRIPWQAQRKWGVAYRAVPLIGADPEADLLAACDRQTRVLAASSVQFGTGLSLDIGRLGAACRKRGILFCVDAIQSLGALPLDVQAAHVDFAMADAHKWLLGPEGIALFYCRAEVRPQLELRQFGWHMVEAMGDFDANEWRPAGTARRFECGSPNMTGVYGLSASLDLLFEAGSDEITRRVLKNSSYLIEKLKVIPGSFLLTPDSESRRAGIVTVRLDGQDHEKLRQDLALAGVICAHRAGGLRFSPHFYNRESQIDNVLEILNVSI